MFYILCLIVFINYIKLCLNYIKRLIKKYKVYEIDCLVLYI